MTASGIGFEVFATAAEPRLRRAFAGVVGVDLASDATAEALAYAWQHWERVEVMTNPIGYLFAVGRSRVRQRRRQPRWLLPSPQSVGVPDIEPGLVPALLALPETQRTAVWLVHACQWRYGEVAEAMGISTSAVGTHVSRALTRLRERLDVKHHA